MAGVLSGFKDGLIKPLSLRVEELARAIFGFRDGFEKSCHCEWRNWPGPSLDSKNPVIASGGTGNA